MNIPLRQLLLQLLLPLLPFATCQSQSVTGESRKLTVMTWNIRYNNPDDGVNAWPNRKEKVISFLRETKPVIFCIQEVLSGQLNDIATSLPQYSWFGAGRDDGKKAGEYVPVFYDRQRYRLLKGDHFWLSGTPGQPGKPAWDAACTRMVTWICLADQKLKDTLFVFNTHFDHIGVKARLESAGMLSHAADSLSGHHPAIITGDFNSTEKDAPYLVITSAGFNDSRAVSKSAPAGPEYTYTGFDIKGKPGGRIDYIYVRNTKPVQSYLVRDDSSNGYYLSDHLPVMVGW